MSRVPNKSEYRIPQEQIDEVVKLYGLGLSLREIGERMYLSPATVMDRLRRAGVPRRKQGAQPGDRNHRFPSHDDMDKTLFLYQVQRLSMGEVAKELGLRSHSAIQRRLKAAGVQPRSREESYKIRSQRIMERKVA